MHNTLNILFFTYCRIAADLPKDTLKDIVIKGDAGKVQHLLKSSLEVENNRTIEKDLLLHEAIKNDHVKILEILLKYSKSQGQLLFVEDGDGRTILHLAVFLKREACCQAIMDCEPKIILRINKAGETPLHLMVNTKYLNGCKKALKCLPDSEDINVMNNKQHHTVVHLAAKGNLPEMLELFLENGGNPCVKSRQNYTPLHYAAESGSTSCIDLLLNKINEEDKIAYINNKSSNGTTALMLAAKHGFSDSVKHLEGANINLADNDGYTALHFAAKKGSQSVVESLCDKGANIDLETKGHQTAVVFAVTSNEFCLEYLLNKYTNIKKAQSETLLKIAVNKNQSGCLRVLLARPEIKEHINFQIPNDKNTLLHLSLKKSYYKITRELLKNGAERDLLNDRQELPLHLAAAQKSLRSSSSEEERMEECRNILRQSHNFVNAQNQ